MKMKTKLVTIIRRLNCLCFGVDVFEDVFADRIKLTLYFRDGNVGGKIKRTIDCETSHLYDSKMWESVILHANEMFKQNVRDAVDKRNDLLKQYEALDSLS